MKLEQFGVIALRKRRQNTCQFIILSPLTIAHHQKNMPQIILKERIAHLVS